MHQYLVEQIRNKNPVVARIMEDMTTDIPTLQAALSLVSEEANPPDTLEKLTFKSESSSGVMGIANRLELLYNEAEAVDSPMLAIGGVSRGLSQKEFKMLKAIVLVGVTPNPDVALQLQPLLKSCMMNIFSKAPLLKGIGKSGEYFHDKVLTMARKLLKIDGVLGFSDEELNNIDELAKLNIIG